MNHLIIHIGTHKTGSTALQQGLLALSENKFKRLGYRYSHEGYTTIRPKLREFEEQHPDSPKRCQAFSEFAMAVNKHIKEELQKSSLIWSCEAFCGDVYKGYSNVQWYAQALHLIAKNIPTYIVVYFRQQDHFLESLYVQHIHGGGTLSFPEFIQKCNQYSYDWSKIVHAYATEFGEGAVFARNYRDCQKTGGTLADFLGFLEVEDQKPVGWITSLVDATQKGKLTAHNSSYDPATAEFARMANRHLSTEERRKLRWFLQNILKQTKAPFETHGFFSFGERQKLCDQYLTSNQRILDDDFFTQPCNSQPSSLEVTNQPEWLFVLRIILSLEEEIRSLKSRAVLVQILANSPTMKFERRALAWLKKHQYVKKVLLSITSFFRLR